MISSTQQPTAKEEKTKTETKTGRRIVELNVRGIQLLQMKRYDEAIKIFEGAIESIHSSQHKHCCLSSSSLYNKKNTNNPTIIPNNNKQRRKTRNRQSTMAIRQQKQRREEEQQLVQSNLPQMVFTSNSTGGLGFDRDAVLLQLQRFQKHVKRPISVSNDTGTLNLPSIMIALHANLGLTYWHMATTSEAASATKTNITTTTTSQQLMNHCIHQYKEALVMALKQRAPGSMLILCNMLQVQELKRK